MADTFLELRLAVLTPIRTADAISDDNCMDFLLQLAKSKVIGLAHFSYSPNQDNATVWPRLCLLIQAVFFAVGAVTWEFPESLEAAPQDAASQELMATVSPTQVRVPGRCYFGPAGNSFWHFASSFSGFSALEPPHWESFPPTKARRPNVVSSASDHDYPPLLAQVYADIGSPLIPNTCDFKDHQAAISEDGVRSPLAVVRHRRGGGGRSSVGDWRVPPASESDFFKLLRRNLIEMGLTHQWDKRILAHILQGKDTSPFTAVEEASIRQTIQQFCINKGLQGDCTVASEQPFALNLLLDLATISRDLDCDIAIQAARKVHTGCFESIPYSGMFRKSPPNDDRECAQRFDVWLEGNWSAAEADPETTRALVAKEVEHGFVKALPGGEAEARRRWPGKVAKSRLSLIKAPGKKPRLALDSTVDGVNPGGIFHEASEKNIGFGCSCVRRRLELYGSGA